MKKILIAVSLLLTACASTRLPEVTKVPVMVKCPIILPQEPDYPNHYLKDGDSFDLVAKSYDTTVKLQRAHIKDIENRIKPCL